MTRRQAFAQRLMETCERERRLDAAKKAREEKLAADLAAATPDERAHLVAREVLRVAEGVLRRRRRDEREDLAEEDDE